MSYTILTPYTQDQSTAFQSSATDPFESGDATDALKRKFAEVLMRNNNDALAAAKMTIADARRASYVAAYWPADPLVIVEVDRIFAERGSAAYLPSKDEFADKLLRQAEEIKSFDTKLDYLKLFADVMGFTPKNGGTNVNVQNNVVVQKVMKVPAFGSREEARTLVAAQQAKLVNAAAS